MGLAACLAVVAWLGWAVRAPAVDRFPRPEFESGYAQPRTTAPLPRSPLAEGFDAIVFVAALGLASYLALRVRSRRALFLLMLFCLVYFGFWRKGCVCPVGSIQNVTLALFNSTYIVPFRVSAFFAFPLLFALLFGRTFCAAVCPLGGIQDLVVLRPLKIPRAVESALGIVPQVYLGVAVLMAAAGIRFVICRYDPFVGFFRFGGSLSMLVFGVVLLGLGTVVGRPYCRFLCPYGVLLGWMSRFSRWHARIAPAECTQCRLCEDACPFGAIAKPTPETLPEPRRRGVRRLALVLCLIPVSVLLGGWASSRLDIPLSRGHIRVRIAERMLLEQTGAVEGTTLDTDSFRSTGELTRDLQAETLALRTTLRRGGWILGAFIGVAIAGRLLGLSVYRTRKDYEPDRALCVSCGRCFMNCPHERQRLREAAGEAARAGADMPIGEETRA
ncbi:MAG: 4Fe-4S binding protein [Kiritimatiellae bacterium]|nr:4Fe-4S binding protein [Kiritimatiellia bacterium]